MTTGTVAHLNGTRNVVFQAGGTYDTTRKLCSGTACHAGTVRWGGTLANDCQSCHSDQGAGSYGAHLYTGKHQKHTNSVTYKIACENCHTAMTNGAPSITTHAGGDVTVNQAAQVIFRMNTTVWKNITYGKSGTSFRYTGLGAAPGLGLAALSPVYTPDGLEGSDTVLSLRQWTRGRCAAVWCHSDGQSSPTWQTYANWSTAETTNCRSCHAGNKSAAPTMASGKHGQHINNADLGKLACINCHDMTVSSDTAISGAGYAVHVNGKRDVSLQAVVGNYTGTYVSASLSCRANYCHSSGQATPNFRTTAAWNSVTNYDCKACHGADAGFATKFGEPNYANLSTATRNTFNGHQVPGHVTSINDCIHCHLHTVNSFGGMTTGTVAHINGTRNVVFQTAGGSYDAVNKQCTNVSCHLGVTLRWGGVGRCEDCHRVTTADVDDYVYGGASAKAVVNYQQYTSVGHGKKIGNYRYSNNTPANLGCTACHKASVAHNTASNPFRLTTSIGSICIACHPATSQKNHIMNNMVNNSVTTWNFTPKCVDCHDPHGDNGGVTPGQMNYAMIQSYVNYSSTSDTYGKPSVTHKVDFPAEATRPASKTRLSYVTATFDGICQVCHERGTGAAANTTNAAYFNRATNAEATHYAGQLCSGCHTHPNAFAPTGGDCKGCHGTGGSATGAGRKDIQLEFGKNSHHIQGGATWSTISTRHCARCHGEAFADGSQNTAVHNLATSKAVWLKVWGGAFTNFTGITALTPTFVTYSTGNGSLAGKSANTSKLNNFCIGCHSRTNTSATPFKIMGVTDTNRTSQYSWDAYTTIQARWANTGTTVYSKYSPTTNNVVPQLTKSFSPHASPSTNQRGVVRGNGGWFDDSYTPKVVGCLDCHNSHGSNTGSGGTSTSYSSAAGGYGAGILKSTATYTPTAGGATKPYSASAAMCFDCHLGDNATAPVKNTTFGNRSAIRGYYDAGRWQTADLWKGSFAYKYGSATVGSNGNGGQKGGHFGTSSALKNAAGSQVSGRCVVCHDPHGVAPGTNSGYMLPALKGTWMTSPYKEDAAATVSSATDTNTYGARWNTNRSFKPSRFNPKFNWNNPPIVGGGYGKGKVGSAEWDLGGNGASGYFIDDNTFGTSLTYGSGAGKLMADVNTRNATATAKHMTENDTKFAGLCLNCHTKANLLGNVSSLNGTDYVYVHNTVAGWSTAAYAKDIFKNIQGNMHNMNSIQSTSTGDSIDCTSYVSRGGEYMPVGYRWSVPPGNTNTNTTRTVQPPAAVANTQSTVGFKQVGFHQFPCSKCHTAHTSKLPRLMKTNCLDVGTATTGVKHVNGATYSYPNCDTGSPVGTGKWYMNECHNMKKENIPGGGGWNRKTGW
jgi:predicted CxxxxCH...CXXCH cytochrome family protein